jgi:uncharacterized protein (DUF1330 family)
LELKELERRQSGDESMIETLMGLDVSDDDGYQAYRDAMSPLLERIGGGFRYDFTIAKTLRSSAGHEINRVFIIYFPNRQARDRFFDDEAYREIRGRLFETSVRDTTIIGEWEVGPSTSASTDGL